MRARLAIRSCQLNVELREVVLRHKPAAMLAISPKATVPVLQLADGHVIDESWDIAHWACQQQDPAELLGSQQRIDAANQLVSRNDKEFKHWLDRYKYADRYPEFSAEYYRQQAESFLQQLNQQLSLHAYLVDAQPSLADIGIFPFVRQFAHVDIDWFNATQYRHLQAWFKQYINSALFTDIMNKYPPWEEQQAPVIF